MKIHHYSHSSFNVYKSCPKKFEFSKLNPEIEMPTTKYMEFGSAFHEAVENYHNKKVYNTKLIEAYTKEIDADFYDSVEKEILIELKDVDSDDFIDTPFLAIIDGMNKDGLYDLKTTGTDLAQSKLNSSDQATLYCYMHFLQFAKIPIFHYIIYSRKNNTIKMKETYRSEKNFREFFKKMKVFDEKVKGNEFDRKLGRQCLYCPFAKQCVPNSLYEVLERTHGKL